LKLTMPSGETYEGHFVNGKRHGIGVAVMPDGSRYQGEWKAGNRRSGGIFGML
jgi:hypothetical protein